VVAFYVDNDVSLRLGPLLGQCGHLVTYTLSRGAMRAGDEQQLLTALDLQANLITHNYADFVLLHRAWHLWTARWKITEPHPAIFVLLQGHEWYLSQQIEALLLAGEPSVNRLYRYRASVGWVDE
jgi:hypothetical protein